MKRGTSCRLCQLEFVTNYLPDCIKTRPDFCSVSGDTLTKHIMAAGLYKS